MMKVMKLIWQLSVEGIMQRLKGYAEVKIVAMQHHYKSSNGQRLPNPPRGCPLSLQLEPSNPYHHNAIKVINVIDTRHLGYIVREVADVLTMLLNDNNTFASARAILCGTHSLEVISCQVLLFFAVPHHLVPPLPPQLGFHEDLSSPDFVLANTPVAFTGCTLHHFDEYMASLHLQPLLRPCSTNIDKVTCMKCKQTGSGGPFFQCASSGCPLLIHKSCIIGDAIGEYCDFCQYLARRKEYHQSKKDSSSCTVACREEYKKARDIAIRFLGGKTFMRLRELTGLDPLPPGKSKL